MPWREATSDDGENAHLCGCHLWTGYTDPRGCPVVRTATSTTTARRAAWEREYGPVPDGLVVTPICGETLCVLPSHLMLASERLVRYRSGQTKRDRHLRQRAVRLRIRGWSKRRIARSLGVDERTIRAVLSEGCFDPAKEKTRPNGASPTSARSTSGTR